MADQKAPKEVDIYADNFILGCTHPSGRHRWAVPVIHILPSGTISRHHYAIPGMAVQPQLVFCRSCGQSAPVG